METSNKETGKKHITKRLQRARSLHENARVIDAEKILRGVYKVAK